MSISVVFGPAACRPRLDVYATSLGALGRIINDHSIKNPARTAAAVVVTETLPKWAPLGVLTGTLTRFQAPCRQSPSRPCWARDVVLEPFPGLFLERPAHEAFFHPVDVAAQSGLHLDAILEKLVSKAGRYPLVVVDERQSLKEDGGTASASVAL